MPITSTSMYRTREDVLAEMLADLVGAVPDAYVGPDGTTYIIFSIESGQFETLYLSNQLLLQDIFISTASLPALQRHGGEFGVNLKDGTRASGTVRFSGAGGTYIPVNSEVGSDPGSGLDVISFLTTIDGTVPNPGTPTAPVIADAGAGTLTAGTYEFAVTFLTAAGETTLGAISNALTIAASHNVNVTGIPLGGPGTIGRSLYQRVNGGAWTKITNTGLVAALANNTTTSVTVGLSSLGGTPPTISTAQSIDLAATATDPGVDANVITGAITELNNVPAAIISVVNLAPFAGGSDPEDTEDYRQRVLDFIRSPGTGSPSDIKVWAENVSGVDSATVFSNTPSAGEVTVRISGPGGTVPSAGVISDTLTALNAQDVANVVFHVFGFTANVTAVTVDVTTSGTFTLGDVTPSVQQAITDYINSLDVGATLYLSGIVDAVFGLPGIADVVVTTPATNQTTAATDKRTPGTITVV